MVLSRRIIRNARDREEQAQEDAREAQKRESEALRREIEALNQAREALEQARIAKNVGRDEVIRELRAKGIQVPDDFLESLGDE